ncbi:glycosyltransferase [Methylobacterium sp. SD21]|uniref:glycosyltransferase n=1 Tax=Methylobacterium litchii TaxID=3138810 RepID=UPI00313B6CC0
MENQSGTGVESGEGSVAEQVNSKQYWDGRFRGDWEKKGGPAQTIFFCKVALNNSPSWLFDDIRERKLSICDWGCALGDAVEVLSEYFVESDVSGYDFSGIAIEQAAKQYPNRRFSSTPFEKSSSIIFSSNVLEHFVSPQIILDRISKISSDYIWLLLPFQDYTDLSEHFFVFDYNTIPPIVGRDFYLSYIKIVDTSSIPNTWWSGQQVLLVYAKDRVLERVSALVAESGQKDEFTLVGHTLAANVGRLATLTLEHLAVQREMQDLGKRLADAKPKVAADFATVPQPQEIALEDVDIHPTSHDEDPASPGEDPDSELDEALAVADLPDPAGSLAQPSIAADTQPPEPAAIPVAMENVEDPTRKRHTLLHKSELFRLQGELDATRSALSRTRDMERNLAETQQKFYDFYRSSQRGQTQSPSWTPEEPLRNSFSVLGENDTKGVGEDLGTDNRLLNRLKAMCALVNSGMRRGLFVITSAFEFSPEYNQRPIALAKEAAAAGYFVVFVAWQWGRNEDLAKRGMLIGATLLQIGRFDLEDLLDTVRSTGGVGEGEFMLTIPSDDFVERIADFRSLGFRVTYDILDDWEEFKSVGQAVWWSEELERQALAGADRVTVVSPRLKDKFDAIRPDIRWVANGLRGVEPRDRFVSKRSLNADKRAIVGYFGHLTDSWFDWRGIIALAKVSSALEFRLIGYGEPDWVRTEAAKLDNVTLVGFVPADRLAEHVADWHVAIIPFVPSKLSEAVDPIKIYEYLYFGLPVIASGMPHLADYPETTVVADWAAARPAIEAAIERLVAGDLNYDVMAEFASMSTWRRRFLDWVA